MQKLPPWCPYAVPGWCHKSQTILFNSVHNTGYNGACFLMCLVIGGYQTICFDLGCKFKLAICLHLGVFVFICNCLVLTKSCVQKCVGTIKDWFSIAPFYSLISTLHKICWFCKNFFVFSTHLAGFVKLHQNNLRRFLGGWAIQVKNKSYSKSQWYSDL